VHHPLPEHPSHLLVVAVVVAATPVRPATHHPLAEMAEAVEAVTGDHQHGMAPTVALALAVTEQQAQVVAVAVAATALEHKFLAVQMVVAAAAVRGSLCCVTCYLPQLPQILQLLQTAVHHPQTTSRATKHSPSRATPE
jgi:hypothetical protein